MCLLRQRGQTQEATQLETEQLKPALEAARRHCATPDDFETHWHHLRQTEEERVNSAAVLADLLAPLLADRLAVQVPAGGAATPARTASPKPSRPTSAPAEIADLIDSMLDQQRSSAPARR